MISYLGPPSIPAGLVPGGLVVHCYAVPSGERLYERWADDFEGIAEAQLEVVDLIREGHKLAVRLYCGDSGEPARWPYRLSP